MADDVTGPIDYLVLEFPEARFNGSGLAAIVDLVDRGIVTILDLRVVKHELDGTWTALTISDMTAAGFDVAVFEGVSSGLLDDDDLREAAAAIEPGSAAGILVYENTWARPFVAAVLDQGASFVTGGRIPATDVVAALDRLDSADAGA
jgi:hypothetical protein